MKERMRTDWLVLSRWGQAVRRQKAVRVSEIKTTLRSLPDLCAERGSAESKSETKVGGCAKAGAAGQNLGENGSGQQRRTSAFDRVQVGTRRWVCEGRS